MLDSGEDNKVRSTISTLKNSGFLEHDYKEVVFTKIVDSFLSHKYRNALDMWHVVMTQLRKFLKGYEVNLRGDIRRKAQLVGLIGEMDNKADNGQMNRVDWS
jgi:hypothetical protein